MEEYTSFVTDKEYRENTLNWIKSISDFRDVPESLYYIAILMRRYLDREGKEKGTQRILFEFIDRCDRCRVAEKEKRTKLSGYRGAREEYLAIRSILC